MNHYCRNYDADYYVDDSYDICDNGTIKRFVVEVQNESGDAIDYISFPSEEEAHDFINLKNKTTMNTYNVTLLRTYATDFEIEAESYEEAREKFYALGDSVYEKELQQCEVIEEQVLVNQNLSK